MLNSTENTGFKYDFDIDYSLNNVWSFASRYISPNSRVLEFGPATGYFTKHLTVDKNCSVYIVEYDQQSFDKAILVASDGICDDIEDYKWESIISGKKFDYIVFLDVLEHLKYPETVLRKCMNYLEDKGSMVISLPNIAHNSVLIDLINDNFQYTELGLLDRTHLRFFAFHQVLEMLNNLGLYAKHFDFVYKRVGETEKHNSYSQLPLDCISTLKNRNFGNVYQFVLECKVGSEKSEISANINLRSKYNYCMKIMALEHTIFQYFHGDEKNISIELETAYHSEVFIQLFDIDNALIKIRSIMINGDKLADFGTNAVYKSDGEYYFVDKPMLNIIHYENINRIDLSLEFIAIDNSLVPYLIRRHKENNNNDELFSNYGTNSQGSMANFGKLINEMRIFFKHPLKYLWLMIAK